MPLADGPSLSVATLHLISGLPGSGKSTYAATLHADTRGVLFSLDRWLITVYGRYSLEAIGSDEHVRRVRACRDLIWFSAGELLQRGTDVILDDGFFLREHRQRYATLAAALGASARTHFVDTPLGELESRLRARNDALPPHNFYIDPAMLAGFSAIYEQPDASEGIDLVVVRQPVVAIR